MVDALKCVSTIFILECLYALVSVCHYILCCIYFVPFVRRFLSVDYLSIRKVNTFTSFLPTS